MVEVVPLPHFSAATRDLAIALSLPLLKYRVESLRFAPLVRQLL